jgi:hypothetical protein
LTVWDHDPEIPENHQGLLESTALAHVATIDPGDERVVIFVKPRHFTQTGA